MKKLIAPFLWDANNKSISFMIIDNQYHVIIKPQKYDLKSLDLTEFMPKVDKIIKAFYKSIIYAYHAHPRCDVKIEYKIFHQVSHELADYYQPSDRSVFIRKKFLENYAMTKSMIVPMKLSQQLRSRLKKPELDEFKKALRDMHIVGSSRKNTYQYHLWILAAHATKSNYKKVLKRLCKLNKSFIKAA